jgi:N-acetylneuraminic acid mutarotase
MYVFGGFEAGNITLNDLHVYDPASGGSWTDLSTPTNGSPPSVRHSHSSVELGGKMYILGGQGYDHLNDLHVYDPVSGGSWAELPTPTSGMPPSGRFNHSSVELDGKMYVFGGYDGTSFLNDLFVYDPASDGWTNLSTPTSGSPPRLATLTPQLYSAARCMFLAEMISAGL